MEKRSSCIIVADGGIDLPEGYAEHFGIHVMPLMVHFGSEQFRSGIDITVGAFYDRLRVGDVHPTTSQPSAGDYMQMYENLAQQGLPILSFHCSGGLSGSVRSAHAARQMLPHLDMRVVDTGTLSSGMAMQVMVAAQMAQEGVDPALIIAETVRIGQRVNLYYTLDTLEYLRRGGRIGRVAGYVGSLLGIRPIITVDKATGTYVAAGRARSFRQACTAIMEKAVEELGEGASVSAMIMHADCPDEARRMADLLQGRLQVQWLEISRVNPALGVHVGPATVGIAFYPGVLPINVLERVEAGDLRF